MSIPYPVARDSGDVYCVPDYPVRSRYPDVPYPDTLYPTTLYPDAPCPSIPCPSIQPVSSILLHVIVRMSITEWSESVRVWIDMPWMCIHYRHVLPVSVRSASLYPLDARSALLHPASILRMYVDRTYGRAIDIL